MPELNNSTLAVSEDYAIDKEIIVDEDEIEPMKPSEFKAEKEEAEEHPGFDVVKLPPKMEEFAPLNITDMRDKWDTMEFGADKGKETIEVEEDESLAEDYQAGPVEKTELAATPDDKLTVSEDDLIPGSSMKFEEDKAEDKPVPQTDWAKDSDHSKFVAYIMEKKTNIPRHSGDTIPGNERAKHYLKSLDNEISQAMRSDLKGVIDEQQIDAVRKEIEKMIDRLDAQISKLKKKQKKADLEVRLISEGQCERCDSVTPMWHDVNSNKMVCMSCEAEREVECEDCDEGIEKQAGVPILNVYVTPWERAITGILINATVSGGKNIEDVYEHLKKKYAFTPREELSILQILSDSGYPIYKDRGRIGEESDPSDGKGMDWQTGYYA